MFDKDVSLELQEILEIELHRYKVSAKLLGG